MRTYRSALAILMAALLLTACPVPIPPHSLGTRENVADTVPAFIKIDETTREDVFMMLGEPDGVAIDDSWVVYSNGRSKGGVAFVMAAGGSAGALLVEGSSYRRLIVRFDDKGVVTFATLETKNCPHYAGGAGNSGGESSPCLDIEGKDIPAKFNWPDKRPAN